MRCWKNNWRGGPGLTSASRGRPGGRPVSSLLRAATPRSPGQPASPPVSFHVQILTVLPLRAAGRWGAHPGPAGPWPRRARSPRTSPSELGGFGLWPLPRLCSSVLCPLSASLQAPPHALCSSRGAALWWSPNETLPLLFTWKSIVP